MDELRGRIALITGAGSGIGASTARLFAEESVAGVTLADIQQKPIQSLAEELEQRFGTPVLVSRTDVSDPSQVEEMVRKTVRKYDRLDILVNSAGICPMVPWDETNLENWNRILSINLTGAYLCCKAVLPHMRRQQFGRLVHISSVGGFVGSITGHVAYGASKAAVIALSKYLAKQFASEGILSNVVAPGTIDTPLTDSFGAEHKHRFIEASLLKRQGSPRELAEAVLFLSSSRSSYVTGSTMHVNGGSLLI